VIEKLRPGAADPGDIVDEAGRVLGRHRGVIHYTIGQRRGLGIGGRKGAEEEPLYVLAIDADARRIVVGPKRGLARETVTLRGVNWLGDGPLGPDGMAVEVKVRSMREPVAATIAPVSERDGALVRFAAPEYGVAPGQACVFYAGSRVLGGGWIAAA
jgi:tRNA-specific 2-thiouridylase